MFELSIALVVFLFPLAYSPGPGNMFFAANGARFGVRKTLPANFGYHGATLVVTLALGFSFAAAMNWSPQLFTLLKWAGSAYVLYLAWTFLRAGTIGEGPDAVPAGLADGVLLLLLNPKAYLIITLMFTQFLDGDGPGRATSVVWISALFTVNNFIAFLAWTVIGDRMAERFRNETDARRLNTAFGIVLAAVAVWMAPSRRIRASAARATIAVSGVYDSVVAGMYDHAFIDGPYKPCFSLFHSCCLFLPLTTRLSSPRASAR